MAEPPIPKLTDDEATVLRRRLMGHARTGLASAGLRCHGIRQGPSYSDLGRAALAAYDAEQRRAIRVEAMRECRLAAMSVRIEAEEDAEHEDDDRLMVLYGERAYGARKVVIEIEALIAKEESNG